MSDVSARQQHVIRTVIKDLRGQISVWGLMKRSTPLCGRLCDCYEKITIPAMQMLLRLYSRSVYTGMINWAKEPERIRLSSYLDEEIMRLFTQELTGSFSQQLEGYFQEASREILTVMQETFDEELHENDCQSVTLDMLDMHSFQLFWSRRLGEEVTKEAAQMVEEFNFWELLQDLPQMPEEYHSGFRMQQVQRLTIPLLRQLKRDQIQLSVWLTGFFMEEKFLTVFRNQILYSLNKWEKSLTVK